MPFSTIQEAINDFKKGKFVIVVDNEDRENEADLVLAAQFATPEKINFMIRNACGLVCVPMLGKRLDELELPLMTRQNTSFNSCHFTISADYKNGTTTGTSAYDRAMTIKALADKNSKPEHFARPGHVFPLRCNENGLRERLGHTEASVALAKLAKLYPAAVICEIIGKDGNMAEMPEINQLAERYGIKIVKIVDLIKYNNEIQQ